MTENYPVPSEGNGVGKGLVPVPPDDAVVLNGEFIRADRPRLNGPRGSRGRFLIPVDDAEDVDAKADSLHKKYKRAANDPAFGENDTVVSNAAPLALPGPVAAPTEQGDQPVRKIRCADGRYIYDYGHELRARNGKLSSAQAQMIAQMASEKGWKNLYVYRDNGRTHNAESAAMIRNAGIAGGVLFAIATGAALGTLIAHKGEALEALSLVGNAAREALNI